MFFVIPEMPSKTFVMVLKKLPDHFKQFGLFKAFVNINLSFKLEEETKIKADLISLTHAHRFLSYHQT